jgi:hypothetical protein
VRLVAALAALESLAVLVAAGFSVASLLSSLGKASPMPVGGSVFLLVLMLLVAVWQAIVAVKHVSGRAWTRSAVVVWQLFQIILGIYYLSNAPRYQDWLGIGVGVGMVVVGCVALLFVFSPATRLWLEPDDAPR